MEAREARARKLDFGELTEEVRSSAGYRNGLRLAPCVRLHGPGKYRVLDLRRRRAQIRARHALGL